MFHHLSFTIETFSEDISCLHTSVVIILTYWFKNIARIYFRRGKGESWLGHAVLTYVAEKTFLVFCYLWIRLIAVVTELFLIIISRRLNVRLFLIFSVIFIDCIKLQLWEMWIVVILLYWDVTEVILFIEIVVIYAIGLFMRVTVYSNG